MENETQTIMDALRHTVALINKANDDCVGLERAGLRQIAKQRGFGLQMNWLLDTTKLSLAILEMQLDVLKSKGVVPSGATPREVVETASAFSAETRTTLRDLDAAGLRESARACGLGAQVDHVVKLLGLAVAQLEVLGRMLELIAT